MWRFFDLEGHSALTASRRLIKLSLRESFIGVWVAALLLVAMSAFIGQPAWAQADDGIDIVIPSASVSEPANGSTASAGVISITGGASDDASGVERVLVRVHRLRVSPAEYWNGSAWTPSSVYLDATVFAGGESWTLSDVDMTQAGNYRIRLQAIDFAGNRSRPLDNLRTDFEVAEQDLLTVTTLPVDVTASEGDDAVFSVAATGSGSVSYQWQANGIEIPGATDSELVLTQVALNDSGNTYRVAVTDDSDDTIYASATLTVLPVIEDDVIPFADVSAPANGSTVSAGFIAITGGASDDASGVERVLVRVHRLRVSPAEYWNGSAWTPSSVYLEANVAAGAEAWALPDVDLTEAGNYRVRLQAIDLAGNRSRPLDNPRTDFEVVSEEAPVTIVNIGQGSLDSTQATAPRFVRIDLDALATATHTISVSWDSEADIRFNVRGDDGSRLSPTMRGANPGVWVGDLNANSGYYIGLWSTNGVANYTVIVEASVPLSIAQQPTDATVLTGNNATFEVGAEGSGSLTYQWYADGNSLFGETDSSLTVFSTDQSDNGTAYTVEVSNGAATTLVSNPATLTVTDSLLSETYSLVADPSTWTLNGPATTLDYQATATSDGWGRELLRIGDVLLVGGDFTGIRPIGNVSVTARPFLAALDAVTGQPVTSFEVPIEVDDVVRALTLSPDGQQVYVGGDFGLVVLDAVSGQYLFDVELTNNDLPARVFDITVTESDLYIAGDFTRVNGTFRGNIARLTLDGVLDSAWSPNVKRGFRAGRSAPVQSIEVAPDGATLYVGGTFTKINDIDVDLHANGNRISLLPVSTLDSGSVLPTRFDADVGNVTKGLTAYDIAVTDEYVVVAWGGPNMLTFHDVNGQRLKQYNARGDVQALEVVGDVVFVGHHGEYFGGSNNPIPLESVVRDDNGNILERKPFKLHSFRLSQDSDFEPLQAWPIAGEFGVWGLSVANDYIWVAGELTVAGVNERAVEGLVRFQAVE